MMQNQQNNTVTVIGIDTGNKLIKTAHMVFHSGIEALAAPPAIQPKDPMDYIMINGNHYVVSAERLSYEKNKTENSNFLFLTLIGIAKELRYRKISPIGARIVLGIGLPPGHINEVMKTRYLSYFRSNGGMFRFQCGGVTHSISIEDVMVNPQGLSSLIAHGPSLLNKSDLYVIDIGGYTADIIHMLHGDPDLTKVISLDHGVIPMYQIIMNGMNAQFDRRITEQQIDDVLMQRSEFFNAAHVDFIVRAADAYIDRLFGKLVEMQIDLQSSFVVFAGGGASLLQKALERYTSKTGDCAVIPDIRSNAIGYEILANIRRAR